MAVPLVALIATASPFGTEAALIGAAAGVLVGSTSIGAGALLTPALVLLLGVPAGIALGSGVLIAGVMKLFAGGAYALRREVQWASVLRLLSGSVPGALLGLWILRRLPAGTLDSVVTQLLGIAMLASAAASLVRLLRPSSNQPLVPQRWRWLPAVGFATGLLVSLTSVGSGSILLFLLARSQPLRGRELVGTDLAHAFLLSLVAAGGHAFAGRLDPALAVAGSIGAVPGVIAGAALSGVAAARSLRTAVAAVVFTIGVRFVALPSAPRAAGPLALREAIR